MDTNRRKGIQTVLHPGRVWGSGHEPSGRECYSNLMWIFKVTDKSNLSGNTVLKADQTLCTGLFIAKWFIEIKAVNKQTCSSLRNWLNKFFSLHRMECAPLGSREEDGALWALTRC